MVTKEILAANIKALRKKHGDTQEKLAIKLHVNKMTISGWERGEKEPSFENIDKIAEVYKVSVPDLFSSGAEVAFPAIAKEKSEFVKCLCALAASPHVDLAEIRNGYHEELGGGHAHTCDIILTLHDTKEDATLYKVDDLLYRHCVAGLSFASGYKMSYMSDSIFENAVRGMIEGMGKEEFKRSLENDSSDDWPF